MTGELVTEPYHLELRGTLHGPGTPYDWGPGGWSGLGLPPTKSQDFSLDQADGVYAGRDYLAERLLTFPIVWGGISQSDVMYGLGGLLTAWAPSRDEDLELHLGLPGWGHVFFVGRPRGLVEDLSRLKSNEGAAFATFVATDPTIYFPDDLGS